MKKSIIAGFAALILSYSTGFAQELNWVECDIKSDGTVSLEQSLKSEKEQAQVSMVVYYTGKAYEDIATDGLMNVIAKSDQVMSEQGGKYKFEFKINGESDFYTVEISSDSGDSEAFKILYSNPEDKEEVIAELNNAGSKEEVYNILYGEDEGFKKAGFYLDLKENINKENISEILFNTLKSGDITTDTGILEFKMAYAIELLNEKYDITLDDAEDYLNINEAEFSDYWNKDYITDEIKEDIIDALKDKNFKSKNEFNEAILEQIVLNTVKYADGYGNVRDILTDFKDIIGIDTDSLGSTQYRNVLGNSYSDYDELGKDLKKKTSSEGGSGGGGGGGSTGSGKNNSSSASDDFSMHPDVVAPPVVVPVEKVYFEDLGSFAWAKEAINALAEAEIINGKADKLYYPQDSVTREEFATILVKAFDIKKGELETEFSDVVSGSWYENNVKIAASAGVVLGKGDGSFGVGEKITRQDMAVMIARACNLASESNAEKFADDNLISEYAKAAVYAAKDAGIISGVGSNNFNPLGFATRAEAAMIVYNTIK